MIAAKLSRRDTLGLLAGASAAIGLAPGVARAGQAKAHEDAGALSDAIARRLLEADPEMATSLGLDSGAQAHLRFRLRDRSPEGLVRLTAMLRADLARVEAIDAAILEPAQAISLAVIASAFRIALDGLALPYGDVAVGGWRNTPYVVIQNAGAYLDVPRFLEADHPLRNREDIDALLSRLAALPAVLRGEGERIRAARAIGVIPPGFLLDKAIAQMERSLADARESGTLVHGLARRIRETFGTVGNYEARAQAIVTGGILPALAEQLEELKHQRRLAHDAPGISARPHGDAYYAWALRAGTTTTLSPAEIHALGHEELATLHAQMEPILASIGYTSGTIGMRMAALASDPRYQFAPGDPGRAEIMAFIEERIAWIRAQMPRAFRRLASGIVELRRLPVAEEPGAPAAYGGPGSVDGAIPGRMWINLRTTDLHRRYDLPTLVHHEAIPGHVWQGEYANRLPLIHTILSFNAYSEGWALYAQQLADELGAYENDPVGRLGYLQSLAFRACRMVVDTGLHAMGWSREQAITFFVEQNGNPPETVANEVDRYCSWPGQACGYKIGHSEILRQRARAQAALGATYDLRDFNQAIVEGGNVPLDVLAQLVDAYIAAAAQ